MRRSRPAVRITLSGERYDELLVEAPDPGAIVARLSRPSR
jgi:hypothetical protein